MAAFGHRPFLQKSLIYAIMYINDCNKMAADHLRQYEFNGPCVFCQGVFYV